MKYQSEAQGEVSVCVLHKSVQPLVVTLGYHVRLPVRLPALTCMMQPMFATNIYLGGKCFPTHSSTACNQYDGLGYGKDSRRGQDYRYVDHEFHDDMIRMMLVMSIDDDGLHAKLQLI